MNMDFFIQAIDTLKIIVLVLGAGMALWGGVNLMEAYGQDNPAAKSQGIKMVIAGAGIAFIALALFGALGNLITTNMKTP